MDDTTVMLTDTESEILYAISDDDFLSFMDIASLMGTNNTRRIRIPMHNLTKFEYVESVEGGYQITEKGIELVTENLNW